VRGEAQEADHQGKLIPAHVPGFDPMRLPINFLGLHTETLANFNALARAIERKGARPRNVLVARKAHEPLEISKTTGTIKCFDPLKDYGFVKPDDGGEDILLHGTALRAGGYEAALEGWRIDCEVLKRPRGYQVFRVLALYASAAVDKAGGS
jgi:cold shock CspA family protein